jgi:hypothetical protein
MWQHDEWFSPAQSAVSHPVLALAEDLVSSCRIEQHAFFKHAAESRQALRIWVAQELVITGPFSQLLLSLASKIRNVHIRAMIVEVAYGEHGVPGTSIATGAHPWLLDKLRVSMNIATRELKVLPETHLFLTQLQEICELSSLAAVGALGVGNEKLLIPEYTAAKTAFDKSWPDCAYSNFFDANIDNDTWHAKLMSKAAGALIASGSDPGQYLEAARVSINARMTYYASLLTSCLTVEKRVLGSQTSGIK